MVQKILGVLCVLALVACGSQGKPTKAQYEAMNIADMEETLTFLASDEMKGRDTGSEELKKSAEYLSEKLKGYGYKGLGEGGSFLQKINLYSLKYKYETLKVTYNGKDIKRTFGEDFYIYNRSRSSVNHDAPLYYVQAGLYTDDVKQFDPEKTKGAIVIRRQLMDDESEDARDRSLRTALQEKYGALAVIDILENGHDRFRLIQRFKDRAGRSMDLNKKGTTTLAVSEAIAKRMFKADGIRKMPKGDYQFKSNFAFSIENEIESTTETQNVVAWIDGYDAKLKEEYVAYGAHYDHVGAQGDTVIFNGADDDGSGTTSVLYIAKAMAMNPPARSVMIIFHTGEEKGLLGSAYYADNPLTDMSNMVAMFNMDMVGRSKSDRDTTMHKNAPITEDDEIYLVGSDRISQELHDISEEANTALAERSHGLTSSMRLNYLLNDESHPERIYYRSDHWNYAKNGVPIIFYFDGIHIDYHKPTDLVEYIDFEKIKRVSHLGFATGYEVGMRPVRLKISEKE